jgi:leucyl-tRNA synthetase
MSVDKAKLQNERSSEKYPSQDIELKWQSKWEEEGVYHPDMVSAKRPFFNLMMFPYPSAEGMHVGNMYAFTGADVYGRFQRMQGNDVFEPIGLDGFGIHSENYAIKAGKHPVEQAKISEKNFYRQLRSIGNGFDWTRTVETYKPEYYKWTQWLFIQLFKAGLAYRKKAPVNFCPSCKTVLADEQAVSKSKGKEEFLEEKVCERCDTPVEKKDLEQWFFRITRYSDRLLNGLSQIDWTEKVKIAQRNWIGKSEGALVKFSNSKQDIEVFTTRPDTLFGATFLVLSPEHPVSQSIKDKKVQEYIKRAKTKSDSERIENKEKTGVFSGLYVINPASREKIPVWIADFVVGSYGTGAVFADAHDERDFEFAKKFGIPLKPTLKTGNKELDEKIQNLETCFTEDGILFDSGQFSGFTSSEARKKIVSWLSEKGDAKPQANYHLRDWLISRQRYWGPPIPMVYCQSCADKELSWFTSEEARGYQRSKIKDQRLKTIGNYAHEMRGWYPAGEKDLPVELPYIEDFKPHGIHSAGSGQAVNSPLASHPEFYRTKCPNCGGEAKRETDVSDTFLDSAWYFLRYVSTDTVNAAFDPERVKKWLPVNMYIGGAEHSVLHLLYSRFVTMVLHDLGFISFEEPFTKFRAHGLIVKDGVKMSKSKGNVVVPDAYVKKFGADTLRAYLMFMGPFSQGGDFRDTGIEGMHRFLKRIWNLFQKEFPISNFQFPISEESLRMMHGTIAGVTADMEHLHYNTAIAKLMSYYNFLVKQEFVNNEEASVYLRLLAPFAPHMTEELYQQISNLKSESLKINSIHLQQWPSYDPRFIEEDTVAIPVQVNGKLRDMLKVESSRLKVQSEIEKMARGSEKVAVYLKGKKIRKVIYVPGKVINFVVG